MSERRIPVIGGGLAGSEAAWQLAELGHEVDLFEMRPVRGTPAHRSDGLAEVVCTNSFKAEALDTPHGLLKAEMRLLGSFLLEIADQVRVPAGAALAVDRERFSREVTRRLESHPRIRIRREEITGLPGAPAIVATGPLTSDSLSQSIGHRLGERHLAFFDAIAPIVSRESIRDDRVYRASRYDKGAADYLNCPMSESEYATFLDALLEADVHVAPEWDEVPYFEGCLPIEVMASRGRDTLRFGPMRPVGLEDPRTGRRPHAVVQLRVEDRAERMWNLVGFQTRLKHPEQERVFRLIPGLEDAEFLRFGSIHRNTYLNSPASLTRFGSPPDEPGLLFAGELTGMEGYTESTACGLIAALNLSRLMRGSDPSLPPPITMLGGLYRYLAEADPGMFQPMNANFGLLDPLPGRIRGRRARRLEHAARALAAMKEWCIEIQRPVPELPERILVTASP